MPYKALPTIRNRRKEIYTKATEKVRDHDYAYAQKNNENNI